MIAIQSLQYLMNAREWGEIRADLSCWISDAAFGAFHTNQSTSGAPLLYGLAICV